MGASPSDADTRDAWRISAIAGTVLEGEDLLSLDLSRRP